MTLLNPMLLLGALLIAVPVTIHLLNRSRYRLERFGGMLFLRQAMVVRAQRLRLRQVALLCLRCLLPVLLALALARPVLRPRADAVGEQPTTHIIVLDGSLSMTRGEGTDNVFHRARQWALQRVSSLAEKDNVQIIWGGGKPQPLFPAPVFDKVHIQNRLRSLMPMAETMNFPLALEQAFWAADSSKLPRCRIYVLTDGQSTGWQPEDQDAWERLRHHRELLKTKPFVYIVAIGADEPVRNLSVTSVESVSPIIDIFRPARFTCEIRNHASSRQRTRVRFLVDGVPRSEREEVIPPGITELTFEHAFTAPGSHYLAVETGGDGLPADDRFVKALVVMRRIRVLVLEGRSDENPWKADAGFLKMALEGARTDEGDGLFDVEVRPQAEMDVCSLDYLRNFQCVVLADMASVSDFFLFGLERFVEAGGGLLVAAGPGTVADEYSRMYKDGQGVLPARLKDVRVYDKRYFQPTFPAGAGKGVVDCFDPLRTHVLTDVNVARFRESEVPSDAVVIAHLEGFPFLVARPYGAGRTMLWTTTLNPEWTNIVLTGDFLPLIQSLIIYLSASVSPPLNVRAGQAMLYSSSRPVTGEMSGEQGGGGESPAICRVFLPSGEQRTLSLSRDGDEWTGRWTETNQAGLYSFVTDAFPTRYFAASPAPAESDLAALSATELAAIRGWLPELLMVRGEKDLQQEIRKETGAREWWQAIALVVIGLLFLETVISWRWSE